MRNQYQYICNQYDTYLSLVIPLVIPLSFLSFLVIFLTNKGIRVV